ncbi:TIGR02678 family protein [Paenibacillus arenilitoris]|uniref:TIGR02678 family protein n=1 Tax=Paenibacillus arenilitoris TaxID=2772299 RepID=A0A927H795_9BACL|nr:TIGR02678 family protein [Paenibacillus arenilitoris]MBD2870800.1 TIGR02678 family protein [Paenibacillus arenilitoris]
MARGGTTSYALRRMRANRKADAEHWNERRRACAHALLNRHWITKEEDPDLFYAIRDQYTELRDWFAEFTGFLLVLTRTMAKLDKAPVIAAPWMGFPEFRESRDYALFTYSLWFLESKTELDQFVLTDIVEQVSEQLGASGLMMDWENYQHRLSMVRALKKLRQLGVLRHIDGEETDWAHDNRTKNVLYECSPSARFVLRHFPKELKAYDSLDDFNEQIVYPETMDGDLRKRRHRIYRRLLLEPAVSDQEWSPDELYYVQTQRRTLMDQMQFMFGLEGSRYREGLFFFHPELSGDCSLFPTAAGVSDLVLLFAGELRRRLGSRDWYVTEQGTVELTRTDVEGLLFQLKQKYEEYWSKEHRGLSLGELAEVLTAHMTEWSLGKWVEGESGERFVVSAVVSRWTADYSWDEGEEGTA